MDKPPMDQICERTGVSADYGNYVSRLQNALHFHDRVWLAKRNKSDPMKTYEEAYPRNSQVVTDKNRERVRQMNELVKVVNSWTDPEMFTDQQVLDYVRQFHILIAGSTNWPERIEDFEKPD